MKICICWCCSTISASCSRVSYSVGSAAPSADIFFSLLFWAENFYKRLVTLSLTALAVKKNPSTAFKVVATFFHEDWRSRLQDLWLKTSSPITSKNITMSFSSVHCITLHRRKQFWIQNQLSKWIKMKLLNLFLGFNNCRLIELAGRTDLHKGLAS